VEGREGGRIVRPLLFRAATPFRESAWPFAPSTPGDFGPLQASPALGYGRGGSANCGAERTGDAPQRPRPSLAWSPGASSAPKHQGFKKRPVKRAIRCSASPHTPACLPFSDVPETPRTKQAGGNLEAILGLRRRVRRFPPTIRHGWIERIEKSRRKSFSDPPLCMSWPGGP
jgi:hypothetical protein